MRFLLILSLLLLSCMPPAIRRQRAALANILTVKDSLLQLTAYYLPKEDWKGETILVLKNVSGQTLSMDPPTYWYTAYLSLRNAAGEPVYGDKVCGSAVPEHAIKTLEPGALLSFKKDFSSVYPDLPSGKYRVYVIYNGTIRDSTGRYLKSEGEIRSAVTEVQTGK